MPPITHPTCVQVTLVAGEEEYPAKIVGFDADTDVAVLSIDRKAQASGWEEGGVPCLAPFGPAVHAP